MRLWNDILFAWRNPWSRKLFVKYLLRWAIIVSAGLLNARFVCEGVLAIILNDYWTAWHAAFLADVASRFIRLQFECEGIINGP